MLGEVNQITIAVMIIGGLLSLLGCIIGWVINRTLNGMKEQHTELKNGMDTSHAGMKKSLKNVEATTTDIQLQLKDRPTWEACEKQAVDKAKEAVNDHFIKHHINKQAS